MVEGQTAQQCCYLAEQTLRYSQPGDHILYYWKEGRLKCKRGWTGRNCDSCGTNLGPPGQYDSCMNGWTGENCDTCADGWLAPTCDQICDGFGYCNCGECEGCIQTGRWEGSVGTWSLKVHLTFRGETCSVLVPGKYLKLEWLFAVSTESLLCGSYTN